MIVSWKKPRKQWNEKTKIWHDNASVIRRGEKAGRRGRRRRWSKDGVDVLLLVPGSGSVLLIDSLDRGPDSSLLWLEKQSTPDTSMHHKEGKCVSTECVCLCVWETRLESGREVHRGGGRLGWEGGRSYKLLTYSQFCLVPFESHLLHACLL